MGAALARGERHPAVVGPAPVVVRGAGEQVALRIVDAPQVRVAQRAVSRRAAPQIDGVGAPRHQLDGEPVAVARALDVARGRLANRDPAGRGRVGGEIRSGGLRHRLPRGRLKWGCGRLRRGRRVVHHLHLVGPLAVGERPGRDVVRAALACGEGHPAVVGAAPVVVRGAGDQVAVGVVDAAQVRVAQGAVFGRAAPQIDGVGAPRDQLDREPVPVVRGLELSRRGAADRDPAGGVDPAREVVRHRSVSRSCCLVGIRDGSRSTSMDWWDSRPRLNSATNPPRPTSRWCPGLEGCRG